MAITAEQQIGVLQITQAMFGAAPGATYLALFEHIVAAGTSVVDLAQTLSGSVPFFGQSYAASLTSSQFAQAFINDLVEDSQVSTADKAVANSYIVGRMAAGATQADIIAELTQLLSSVSAEDAPWGAAATAYNTTLATKIIDNLMGSSATAAAKAQAVNYIVGQMAAGQTAGQMIDYIITVMDNVDYDDGTWGSASALFDNRIEVSQYYSVDKAGAATDLGTLQQALAAVTATADSIATAKAMFDDAQSGLAQDGYLSGATVFVDMNGNGTLDADEESVTTDANGSFTLPAGAFGPIVVTGGTDISTNLVYTGTMSAPAGAAMVTPLTTLMQAMVSSGATVAQAQTNVLTALGLSSTTNLQTLDAIAVAVDSSGTTAEKTAAAQVQAAAVKVANLLTLGTSVIKGVSSTTSATDAMAMVVTALADTFSAATTEVDLTQTTVLKSVMTTAAASVGTSAATTAVAASLNNIASVMASSMASIDAAITDNPTDFIAALSQVAKVQVVAQGATATSLQTGMAAGSIASAVSRFTGTAFTTAVTAAAAGGLAVDWAGQSGKPGG